MLMLIVAGCSVKSYLTNGEAIYRAGKNLQGQKLLDRKKSRIDFVKNCQGCHGKNGDAMDNCNIKWSWLSDPAKMAVPYNDSLFFRFLDKDIKSNGAPARTGVHWDMSAADKKDLIGFLKTL